MHTPTKDLIMDIKQMTHVGRMPVRFNDDYGIVYFMDAHTCIVIPTGCDSTVVELAVRQYIRGMYLAYYRIVHSMPVFIVKRPVIINIHGMRKGEYGIINTIKSTCNSDDINHIISLTKRNKNKNPHKVPSMVHIKLDRVDTYITV